MATVYKAVLSSSSGVKISMWASGDAETIYTVGEWAKAPEVLARIGYHLLAYDDIESAKFLMHQGYEIWEAIAEDEIKVLPPRLRDSFVAQITRYISEPRVLRKSGRVASDLRNGGWPKNTVMYKRIKLARRIA